MARTRHPKITKARLARNIRKLCKTQDIGVTQLARLCGYPKSYISAVRLGHLMPAADRLYRIAYVLDVKCEQLLLG